MCVCVCVCVCLWVIESVCVGMCVSVYHIMRIKPNEREPFYKK